MEILHFNLDTDMLNGHLENLAALNYRMVHDQDSTVFGHISEWNDPNIFLEPRLFNLLFNKVERGPDEIRQVLFGYITDPELLIGKKLRVSAGGIVSLPPSEYFESDLDALDCCTVVAYDKTNKIITVSDGSGQSKTYTIRTYPKLSAADIGLDLSSPTLHDDRKKALDSYLEDPKTTAKHHFESINEGLKIIAANSPDLFELINYTTRHVHLYRAADHYSFSSIDQLGTTFSNVNGTGGSPVFFAEDLAHQCGHTIYNILTLDSSTYFNVPVKSQLRQVIPGSSDTRTVYSCFHGLFTYTCILSVLSPAFLNDYLVNTYGDIMIMREALARLGFFWLKMKDDLEVFTKADILSSKGMIYYEMFKRSHETITAKHPYLPEFDYSNQPYIFSFEAFLAKHPSFLQAS